MPKDSGVVAVIVSSAIFLPAVLLIPRLLAVGSSASLGEDEYFEALPSDVVRVDVENTPEIPSGPQDGGFRSASKAHVAEEAFKALTSTKLASRTRSGGLNAAVPSFSGQAEASGEQLSERTDLEISHAYSQLASLILQRDASEAFSLYRKALELEPGDRTNQILAGILAYHQGKFQEAAELLRSATWDSPEHQWWPTAIDYLQKTYQKLQQSEALAALELRQKELRNQSDVDMRRSATTQADSSGSRVGLAEQYGRSGLRYLRQGELSKAERKFSVALKLHEEAGDVIGMANQLGNLGITYRELGRNRMARQVGLRAIPMFREAGLEDQAGRAKRLLASLDD